MLFNIVIKISSEDYFLSQKIEVLHWEVFIVYGFLKLYKFVWFSKFWFNFIFKEVKAFNQVTLVEKLIQRANKK